MQTETVNIKEILERVLKVKGWKQTRLAKEIGVSNPTITRWLRNEHSDFMSVRRLADLAGVTMNELLGGPDDRTPKPDIEVAQLTNEFQLILEETRKSHKPTSCSSKFTETVQHHLYLLQDHLGVLVGDRKQRRARDSIRLVTNKKQRGD